MASHDKPPSLTSEKSLVAGVKLQLDDVDSSSLTSTAKLTPHEQREMYRKIDRRIVSICSLMYLLAFMDRGNVGNAKLEGLLTQLQITSNDYTIALLIFYIPYCLLEGPSNLLLKKFRPSRYLPTLSFVWGVIMTLSGLVKTWHQLVGVRVCLGAAEAGLAPGIVYFLTFWYPRHELQFRIGLFFGATTIAGAFSGLLAYGISFMDGLRGLEGWSWIFIIEGIATVFVAIVAGFVLQGCDSPEQATFLTPREKAFIAMQQRVTSVAEDNGFKFAYVLSALGDWQVWLGTLVYLLATCPATACALFLPSIINGFGYDRAISQLLTVPPFVFATVVLVFTSYMSDKIHRRSIFIMTGQLAALIGFIIQIIPVSRGVRYFGMFLCTAGAYSAYPGSIAWLANNLAPAYKRAFGMALQVGLGASSGIITSLVYRTKDEPRYILGHASQIGFLGLGLMIVPVMHTSYKRINAQRDAIILSGLTKKLTEAELQNLGDRAPDFRYAL